MGKWKINLIMENVQIWKNRRFPEEICSVFKIKI